MPTLRQIYALSSYTPLIEQVQVALLEQANYVLSLPSPPAESLMFAKAVRDATYQFNDRFAKQCALNGDVQAKFTFGIQNGSPVVLTMASEGDANTPGDLNYLIKYVIGVTWDGFAGVPPA